jgi:hypothetical protein
MAGMKINFNQFEAWFVSGRQHLYGPEILKGCARLHLPVLAAGPGPRTRGMVAPDAVHTVCGANIFFANPGRRLTMTRNKFPTHNQP